MNSFKLAQIPHHTAPYMGMTHSPLPKKMVIYPYPLLVVISQLFYWIIFINDFTCISTGSTGKYFFMIVYVIHKIGGNNNSLNYLNVMVNFHYHGENRVLTRLFPSMHSTSHNFAKKNH